MSEWIKDILDVDWWGQAVFADLTELLIWCVTIVAIALLICAVFFRHRISHK